MQIAHAQLIEQYFPSDIPGYAPDLSGSVINRMLSQNQSQGVELGDFIVRPQISENAGYKSDILGNGDSSSSKLDTSAGVKVNSDWGRDALGASFGVDNQTYPGLPIANMTNWSAALGGALTLGNDTATAAYSHLVLHLSPTDLGVAGVVTPVPYSVDDIRLSYLKLLGRFSIVPRFEFKNFSFGHSSGSAPVDYDGLDHHTEGGALAGLYEISPGNNADAIFSFTKAQFSNEPVNDYTDYGGYAGLDFRGDAVVQYRLLGGVESRRFSDGDNRTITTPAFQIDMAWTPTMLDTVTATGFRQLSDPTSPFALNQIVTSGQLQLDHELRENVFLRANAGIGESVTQSAIAGVENERQTQWNLGASAFWNINRHMRGTLSYAYNQGVASGPNTNSAQTGGYTSFSSSSITIGLSLFE